MTTELICGKKAIPNCAANIAVIAIVCPNISYQNLRYRDTQMASQSVQPFLQGSPVCPTQTQKPYNICSSTPQSVFCYAWQNRQHQVKLFCISLNAFVHAEYTGLYVQLKLMSYKERSVDLNRTSVNSKLNVLKV